jgi:PTH1 family peptidyl-tRNA hydrolase
MFLLACLGNPGEKYKNTRHNAGFMVANILLDKYGVASTQKKFKAQVASFDVGGKKIILAKPETYMNDSGDSIGEIKNYYKLENSQIIAIYDDFSLPVGKIRVRPGGSSAGHNGIKSLINRLGGDDFPRVKIGTYSEMKEILGQVDFVLSKFSESELKLLNSALARAANAAISIIQDGMQTTMNKFNANLI